jgi:predicted transcriptional regulator
LLRERRTGGCTGCWCRVTAPPALLSHESTEHYIAQDNGLMQPWEGRVFLNPPFRFGLERIIVKLIICLSSVFCQKKSDFSTAKYISSSSDNHNNQIKSIALMYCLKVLRKGCMKKLSEKEKTILQTLKKKGGRAFLKKIAEASEMSSPTASKYLMSLEGKGLIVKDESQRPHIFWEIAKEG